MFNELKTAQASAYLLYKAGGTMEHLKLMKLLYLADRLSWKEYDKSITGDDYYSLPYGPVLSKTLNLIHGETLPQLSGSATVWDNQIKDDANYCVSLAKEIDENDEYFWGCLSLNDEQILNRVFADFGHFKTFELVEYTHNKKHVPEWQDPKGSSKKIKLPDLLAHLGKSKAHIAEILQEHKKQEEIDRLFAGLQYAKNHAIATYFHRG